MKALNPSSGAKEIYSAYGYQITEDPHFFDDWYGVTPLLHKRLERLYEQVHGAGRATINEVHRRIDIQAETIRKGSPQLDSTSGNNDNLRLRGGESGQNAKHDPVFLWPYFTPFADSKKQKVA